MADETTNTETGTETAGAATGATGQSAGAAATTTTTTSTETFINPDGTFKDGWHNQFVPEEHRKNTAWLGIKSVGDMSNQITHLQTKLTSQGKGVFPITDKSTPEAIKEFRTAMGIPDSPAGYKLNIPAEVKPYYPEETVIQAVNPKLHALNLTPHQYAGVMAIYAEQTKISTEAMNANPLPVYETLLEQVSPMLAKKAEADLRTKWGDAYDARLNLANRAIEENVANPEEKAEVLKLIGNNPKIADFLATVYHKHFTESSGVDTSLGTGATGQNLDQRINAIQNQLTDELYRKDRVKYNALLEEKSKLYSQKYPDKEKVNKKM